MPSYKHTYLHTRTHIRAPHTLSYRDSQKDTNARRKNRTLCVVLFAHTHTRRNEAKRKQCQHNIIERTIRPKKRRAKKGRKRVVGEGERRQMNWGEHTTKNNNKKNQAASFSLFHAIGWLEIILAWHACRITHLLLLLLYIYLRVEYIIVFCFICVVIRWRIVLFFFGCFLILLILSFLFEIAPHQYFCIILLWAWALFSSQSQYYSVPS